MLRDGEAWRLVLGEAVAEMSALPDGCVDAVVTDPPYGTGAWLRTGSGQGRDRSVKLCREQWDVWRSDWLDDAWRISRGCVGLFAPQTQLASVIRWAGDRPWRLFVMAKTDPQPRFDRRPANAFEPFVVVGGVQPCGDKDYFLVSSPRLNRDSEATGHPHQKRVSAMAWTLSLCCPPGGSVLDPFAGSGSTILAALLTGRQGAGVEGDPHWHAVAVKRLAEAANSAPLFDPAPTQGRLFGPP